MTPVSRLIETNDYAAVNTILAEATGINKLILPSEPDINFWNSAGFYYLQNGMFQQAVDLYQTLYNTQLHEQQKGGRFHKGMALHNLGIAILSFQSRPEAQNYITLAYIEDCITSGKNAVVKLGYKTLRNEFNVQEEILDGVYSCAISSNVFDEYPPADPNIVLEVFQGNQETWVRQASNSALLNLNFDFYKDLLETTKSAGTNDEKKKTLETLSEILFASIKDFTVLPSVRTSKAEIDRIIRNYSNHPLLRNLGLYILIECKNWSDPVGAAVLRDFKAKVEDHRCSSGLLLCRSGITGKGVKDAKDEIRDAYKVKGISIIVITESDLEEIAAGENPISILEKKYEEVKFMQINRVNVFWVNNDNKGKGVKSAVDSCIKLIRDTADLPHHSTVISIVERVKQEIGRNINFKKRIHELTRNLNKVNAY